jgi:hypothetical protein
MGTAATLVLMERPPPDAAKLLEAWMEWERGETPPGRVISNLKTGGLRDLLERLADEQPAKAGPGETGTGAAGEAAAESWTPVV